jgi:hypothetical protein
MNFEKIIENTIVNNSSQDSHTELDISTFHPSQLSMCKRQMLLSKLGITQHSNETLGIFKIGSIIHEWLENNVPDNTNFTIETEKSINYSIETSNFDSNIHIVGTCDVWLPNFNIIVDYKTQSGWYYFDPHRDNVYEQKESHLTQLSLYMLGLGAERGKLVYVDKGKLQAKQFPEESQKYIHIQHNLVENASKNAVEVMKFLEESGFPQSNDDIPFIKCGCWQCDSENSGTNQFSHL